MTVIKYVKTPVNFHCLSCYFLGQNSISHELEHNMSYLSDFSVEILSGTLISGVFRHSIEGILSHKQAF